MAERGDVLRRRVLAALDAETSRADAAEAEVARLRAALAHSKSPCVYCSLPADEWAKCAHGFPGCSRADDAMGCPELGASMALHAAETEVARLREMLELVVVNYEPWMDQYSDDANCSIFKRYTFGDLRRARAALSPKEGGEG